LQIVLYLLLLTFNSSAVWRKYLICSFAQTFMANTQTLLTRESNIECIPVPMKMKM